jgi:hypothetical protein
VRDGAGAAVRLNLAVWFGFVVALGPAVAQPGDEAERGAIDCGLAGNAASVSDRLCAVSPLGDLSFLSGATVSLTGIRLPDEPPWRDAALAWLRGQIHRPLVVHALAAPDRWGRTAARVSWSDASGPSDLARELVDRGLALVDLAAPAPSDTAGLLVRESLAREQGLGLWADARYKALSAATPERLRERIGRFTLVEGRIRSVGERRERTYVNFGSDWASDFTISIPKQVWGEMLRRGVTAATLRGRAIRARGIVEDWQGPALTLTVPETFEFLDESRRR